MTDDPIKRTQATYDQVAPHYAQRWTDRSVMQPHFDRFVTHLQQQFPQASTRFVADVGCGPGFDTDILRAAGCMAFGFDLSWGMLQEGRILNRPVAQADMRQLPIRHCHGLWVNASLLHLPADMVPATLTGFHAALRPGGVLFISVKAGAEADWYSYHRNSELRRFFTHWQADTLLPLVEAAGFDVVHSQLSPGETGTNWLSLIAHRSPAGLA